MYIHMCISDDRRPLPVSSTIPHGFPGMVLLGGGSVSKQPIMGNVLFHHLFCSANWHLQSRSIDCKAPV